MNNIKTQKIKISYNIEESKKTIINLKIQLEEAKVIEVEITCQLDEKQENYEKLET